MDNIVQKILDLKKQKNAVILAHYYTTAEVQDVADFVGDSFALSQKAANTGADIILFAGVRFMAETAKVLSPQKKVLLPDPEAGCSLAESCDVEAFRLFKLQYPDHMVVSYVNTSVGVKALTDICCTSSNALTIINSLPKNQKIIFAPDRNLGNYIKSVTGRDDIVLWDGACHVHEQFSLEHILELKSANPDAKIVAHPECKAPILLVADFVGSTSAILNFCSSSSSTKFIVVTEAGILHEMERNNPHKIFIAAPPIDSTCGCNNCVYMKMNSLENIYEALLNEKPEITIEESIRQKAEYSIRNMLKYK